MGFLIRWLFAFVLLAATYNPTQWNFVRWAMANYTDMLSVMDLSRFSAAPSARLGHLSFESDRAFPAQC